MLAVEKNPNPTKISLMIQNCNLNIDWNLSGSTPPRCRLAKEEVETMDELLSSTASLAIEDATSEKEDSKDNEGEDECCLSQHKSTSTSSSVLSVPSIEVSSAPSLAAATLIER